MPMSQASCNGCITMCTLVHVEVHPLQLALVVFFIQPLPQILILHTWWYHPYTNTQLGHVVVHPLQLPLVVFLFQQLSQIIHLLSSNLHCVVVVYSGTQYHRIIATFQLHRLYSQLCIYKHLRVQIHNITNNKIIICSNEPL